MKLYLHVGTEKTGSSFIQTSFAHARARLLAAGIWYPTAGAREADMRAGRISPGNALPLYRALRRGDGAAAGKLLADWHAAAADQGAQAVLLTNENLIEPLADGQVFNDFLETVRGEDFTDLSLLLVVRDPVDQALSLYKHRAKNGGIAPVEEWLATSYHLREYLDGFRAVIAAHPGLVRVVRYARAVDKLPRVFYREWLNVAPPGTVEHTIVNPSLTLSELNLLNHIHARSPLRARQFYAKMLAVPATAKSGDKFLRRQVRERIADALAPYADSWAAYNELLPPEDSLILPEATNAHAVTDGHYSFSDAQLAAVAEYLLENDQPSARWARAVAWGKGWYGRLKVK